MENEDFSSDTDDDDYKPPGEESEDLPLDSDVSNSDGENKKQILKTQKKNRKRKSSTNPEIEAEDSDQDADDKIEANPEEAKRKKEDLWSDFLKDTNTTVKPKPKTSDQTQKKVENTSSFKKKENQIYNFAGEEVKIKEVDNTEKLKEDSEELPQSSVPTSITSVKKVGGLSSLLGKISNKGTKLTTLEKSKLDWSAFKSEQGIEEELTLHNKGKDGYLDRQAFLQRTDLRQFEIEKQLRINKRK